MDPDPAAKTLRLLALVAILATLETTVATDARNSHWRQHSTILEKRGPRLTVSSSPWLNLLPPFDLEGADQVTTNSINSTQEG